MLLLWDLFLCLHWPYRLFNKGPSLNPDTHTHSLSVPEDTSTPCEPGMGHVAVVFFLLSDRRTNRAKDIWAALPAPGSPAAATHEESLFF